jgi:hypothetical protein
VPFEGLVELGPEPPELHQAADDRPLVRRVRARRVPLRGLEREHRDRLRLALDGDRRELVPDERVAGRAAHRLRHENLAGRRLAHQARGQVARVAEAGERLPLRVAVGAAAQPPVGDPDLDVGGGRHRAQVAQLDTVR